MRTAPSRLPILHIAKGTFYRHHPASRTSRANPPLFNDLSFELPSFPDQPHNWCVVGPSLSGKTTFLHVLGGRLLCEPPTARSYPFLYGNDVPNRLKSPSRAVQYVGFDGENALGGGSAPKAAYLSARYESRRESTDFSVRDFLLGNMELNPLESSLGGEVSDELLRRVVTDLNLQHLLDLPVTFLSNGQGRRARIARALLTRPEVMLLDEPFMGLDPRTVDGLGMLLRSLADKASPRLVLSARPQDPMPDWITHLVYLRSDCQVESMGSREFVLDRLRKYAHGARLRGLSEDGELGAQALPESDKDQTSTACEDSALSVSSTAGGAWKAADATAERLVELDGCQVRYGNKVALGNWTQQTRGGPKNGLVWTVRRGERWGVFGPNGSGKTTLVSLLGSDHPQAYSMPLKLFGRGRLPEQASSGLQAPPLTFWDIQARIGHSSPEVHRHMPRSHTIRRVVESAWASTLGSVPRLDDEARGRVDSVLRQFASELRPNSSAASEAGAAKDDGDLSWADAFMFSDMSFSAQRVALLIRATIKSPDIVVLDEAFSGMDDAIREKCMSLLMTDGLSPRQALICIAHVKEEVPACVRDWVCLPEANTGASARFGRLEGPLDKRQWDEIWREE